MLPLQKYPLPKILRSTKRILRPYDNWLKKDRCSRFGMLSNMHNDLIGEFKAYTTALELWELLKAKFGGTSGTRLHGLTMRFDSYMMRSIHSIKQHLRAMSSMNRELKTTGNDMSDEQQVQAIIRSLPSSWDIMS